LIDKCFDFYYLPIVLREKKKDNRDPRRNKGKKNASRAKRSGGVSICNQK